MDIWWVYWAIFCSTLLATLFATFQTTNSLLLTPPPKTFVLSDHLLRVLDIAVFMLFIGTPKNDVSAPVFKTLIIYFLLQTALVAVLIHDEFFFFVCLIVLLFLRMLIACWLYYSVLPMPIGYTLFEFVFIVQMVLVWNIIVIYCVLVKLLPENVTSLETSLFLIAALGVLIFCFMSGGFHYILHILLISENIFLNLDEHNQGTFAFGLYCLILELILLYNNIKWWKQYNKQLTDNQVREFMRYGFLIGRVKYQELPLYRPEPPAQQPVIQEQEYNNLVVPPPPPPPPLPKIDSPKKEEIKIEEKKRDIETESISSQPPPPPVYTPSTSVVSELLISLTKQNKPTHQPVPAAAPVRNEHRIAKYIRTTYRDARSATHDKTH